ncbi:MAG TPA: MFS transporter [Anaerolineae bacterium]|nr:MFS transporter [Anaerolineae bacterium]
MADVRLQRQAVTGVQNRIFQSVPALGYYNYRLWFAGQLVSLVGTWMETTAQGFLIYQLTNSPAYLGIVGFASGVPSLLFMLFGGVVADRIPRRTLLVITQTTLMCFSFIVAALTFTGLVQPWHIVILALGVGTANAFDAPARQSFVLEMVEREHLGNAIALNSTMFQMATVVGPAVAGVTYAVVGPAWCFTLNGLSFIAVIVALLLMKIKPQPVKMRVSSAVEQLKEGLGYVYHHELIRTLILIAVVVSLFGLSFVTLLPAWAVGILGGDAATNGLLQSARGLGALVAAVMIVSLGNFRAKGKLLTIGSFVFPLALIVFAFVRSIPLSLAVLVVVGWGFMVLFNMLNTLLQGIISDELRGRVMSIYTLSFFGGMPIGSLWAGAVAEHFGEPFTVILGAVISLVFAVLIFWRIPKMRRLP